MTIAIVCLVIGLLCLIGATSSGKAWPAIIAFALLILAGVFLRNAVFDNVIPAADTTPGTVYARFDVQKLEAINTLGVTGTCLRLQEVFLDKANNTGQPKVFFIEKGQWYPDTNELAVSVKCSDGVNRLAQYHLSTNNTAEVTEK